MLFLRFFIAVREINRPFAVKPSRDLLFIKLWAANLRMPEMKTHVENIKTAKFEAPGIKKMRFYDDLNFKKIKKICMEKVAGEQGLALQQLFPYKSSNFF